MKNPRAYVMPFLVVQTLTAAINNKQNFLMKISNDKQYFAMQAGQKLSAVGKKFSELLNGLSTKLSEVTRQTDENGLQATDLASMEKLSNQMQDINAQKAAITARQEAEESQIKAESLAKETPLDMLIKLLEPQIKAMSADRDGWQKVLDDAAKGGS